MSTRRTQLRWMSAPALVFALVTARGADYPEAGEILRRMAAAVRQARFEGEQIVEVRGPKGITSHRHRVFQDQQKLRLEPIVQSRNDRRPITIINRGTRSLYHPAQKTVIQYALKGEERRLPFNSPVSLKPNLKCLVVGEEEIAKRPSWQIEVRQRDGKLRSRLWVDKEKFFPLKRESFGADGAPLETRAFASIDFAPKFGPEKFNLPSVSDLNVRTVSFQARTLEQLHRELSMASFRLINPEALESRFGLKFDGGEVTRDKEDQLDEVWMRFSNPQGRLSVFQRHDRGMSLPAPARRPRRGQHVIRRNGWLVTLVGSAFQASELQQFAEAIEYPDR